MEEATARVVHEYATRVTAINRRLRSEAASATAVVREIAKAIRWFDTPQPEGAIGPARGIYTDAAYQLHEDAYLLRALPHTATGRPAVQIVVLPGTPPGFDLPERDERLFHSLVTRVSRGRVVTGWESHDSYAVAIDVPVQPSLVRAVSSNRHRACSDACRTERSAIFTVPPGWHP